MTDKTKQKKKETKVIAVQTQFNNVEFAKIGELQLSSEVLRSDVLLSLIIGSLENESVKKYLNVIEKKRMGGSYLG